MRLQKVPRAFLDALDLKTDGRAPPEFSDAIAGVLNMAPFYFAEDIQTNGTTGTVTANGDTIALVVPQGQYWLVHSVSGFVDMPSAAAEAMRGAVALRLPATQALFQYLSSTVWADGVVGQNSGLSVAYVASQPWLAPPGSTFLFVSQRTYAAARAASVRVTYWPFEG